ncbi:MAG: hypothetical protein ACD_50C00190G0004 [uncultured bacterium]|nr:MAG: hypothetical protein ACD_50C00190G0004 [uncultured bacterium]
MGSYGGFYKGEKKKKKKGEAKEASSSGFGAPVLTMPEIITKKKPA